MSNLAMMKEWKAEGHAEGMAEGMALGMQEARRTDLLKVLRMRFPDLPSDIALMIRGMSDLDQLGRWFDAALVAPTAEMFRSMSNDADMRVRK